MRLTCPNCGAQYEVPDDIIPSAGRDVQCSSCGTTWFQAHPDHSPIQETPREAVAPEIEEPVDEVLAEEAPETETFHEVEPPDLSIDEEEVAAEFAEDDDFEEMDLGGADWDLEPEEDWPETSEDAEEVSAEDDSKEAPDAPEPEFDVASEVKDTADEDHESAFNEEEEDTSQDTSPAEEQARPRRGIDDSVADILREEAAFETQARAAEEPQSLETQGDLGLEQSAVAAPAPAADPAAKRLRRLRGEDDRRARTLSETGQHSTRRDLLPDIEEINSTLRSTEAPKRKADPNETIDIRARRGRGFRLGFSLVLIAAVAAVFVYSSHDTLRLQYPAAAPYIEAFMHSANGARIWLDERVTQLFLKLNEMTG